MASGRTGLLAATVFLGAFLLFQVQPLIGKAILPWFGGSAAVWTVCVLFFQVGLLAGYCYAHLSIRRLTPVQQAVLHGALLLAGLLFLPVLPGSQWKPDAEGQPAVQILVMLAATAGVPYVVLAATGPLVGAWFTQLWPARSPYRLYALSNAGSLLGLLTYPFVVERWLPVGGQALLWGAGYLLFVLLCGAVAWLTAQGGTHAPAPRDPAATARARPGWRDWLWWATPAACASMLLLAVTNQLCLNVASIPFLWVVPLCLYLISFIVTFGGARGYPRTLLLVLFAPAVLSMALIIPGFANLPGIGALAVSLPVQIIVYCGGLLVACLVCHGELYRLRPEAAHLTAFYLAVALGGALGGVLVGLIAPRIFALYQELHVALLLSVVFVVACLSRGLWRRRATARSPRPPSAYAAPAGMAALLALLVWLLLGQTRAVLADTVVARRNFYGVTRVLETGPRRILMSGSTNHGYEDLGPDRRGKPTAYYTENSGAGLALTWYGQRSSVRVGLVGLGAGTLAAYCRSGDRFRFYEINPQMTEVAEEQFSFLRGCTERGGVVEVVPGDARLSLEAELAAGASAGYDVLVLDAFASDAVPVHLLTAEAFELYRAHLRPGGTLLVHVTNHHLDLVPLTFRLAAHVSLAALAVRAPALDDLGVVSQWVVMTDNLELWNDPRIQGVREEPAIVRAPLWTDRYSNLFSVLR